MHDIKVEAFLQERMQILHEVGLLCAKNNKHMIGLVLFPWQRMLECALIRDECPDREPGAEAFSCGESGGGEDPQLLGLRPPRCEDDR